jgi:hypothetical protein
MKNYGYNPQKLQGKLPMDWAFDKDLNEVEKPFHSFITDDGALAISAENGTFAIDYYGEFRDGCPYIAPKLETWAENQGGYWEWMNPGAIQFCK